MTDTNVTRLLYDGIKAARVGRRAEARLLLMQVVEADAHNEQAWLWLSGVVDDPSDQRVCLENVLDLNPQNQQARQGLAWLDQQQAAPRDVGAARVGEPAALAPSPGPAPQPEPAAASQQTAPAGLPEERYPCPFCGAGTALEQRRCPACRANLMVRVPGGHGLRGILGLGELQRLAPVVEDRDHIGHYNAGIAYKNRGMWYMAVKEWEAAVRKRPADASYRHALGLAYAQLRRYGQALGELRAALAISPDDARLQESLRIVEEQARKQA